MTINPLLIAQEGQQRLRIEIHQHLVTSFAILVQTSLGLGQRVYKIKSHKAAISTIRNGMMPQPTFAQKRAHARFLFSADAEIILRDGTSIPTQVDELSARGCYVGTLKLIPIGTKFRLRIWDGIRTCELEGRVLYVHSGNTLGIIGMGVLFGNTGADQQSVIDVWLHELAGKQAVSPS